MNLSLLLTTLVTSAADSMNPVAITQQFVLQGLVKKRHHICYFIAATFVTNFIFGLLAYYGLLAVLSDIWSRVHGVFGKSLYILGILAGIALLAFSIVNMARKWRKRTTDSNTEAAALPEKKVKSVRPFSLFLLGVAATIMELTTALPYFAFIGLLVNHQLNWIELVFVNGIYNLIYASPLIILYLIFCKKQALFDRAYLFIKKNMEKVSAFIFPAFLAIAAIVLLWNAASRLVAAPL